jgi:hypothetical protein
MRKQDGDGELVGLELGVPVAGAPVAGPLGVPPVGVPGALPLGAELAGALVRGWADGLADGFFPPGVAFGLLAAGVAAVLGPAPPAGPEVRAAPDALCDGTRLAEVAAVEGPAGAWFAAGVPVNTPDTSSATRPPLATTATPTATAAPARRRGFPGGCPGPGGPVGRDMRGGTFHSSETKTRPG